MPTNETGKRLFFMLLHRARIMKAGGITCETRHITLMGMRRVFIGCREDFEIADSMRDYWKHQESGAE